MFDKYFKNMLRKLTYRKADSQVLRNLVPIAAAEGHPILHMERELPVVLHNLNDIVMRFPLQFEVHIA